ncbi:retrovirus-related pol polyprotein from transposon TNT 1-94 [Tanacetum coccineum]|uniref:Retrovirus-related pol polyprotein from transposon TNT 1-94 n=1 Tax=Tanacetum coccineum TaxID=301880 RepID=A0ABQ5G9W8_9ASTR
MISYLKNMEGWKHKDLKSKDFDSIKELFDKAFTRVDGDKDTSELQSLMEVIPDEEEVAIDVIPLATKSPSIVEWKIHKEGKKSYYQIVRADGKSQMYKVFSQMLKCLTREDLEDLYKLVKAKYGSTRLVEDLDLVLWNDLKTMFKPHVEDEIWKLQQRYKVLSWKLFDSCGVHCLSLQSGMIYMLVENRYPLTPPTITDMLNNKLQKLDDFKEEYQVLGRIIGIKSLLNAASITAALIDVNVAQSITKLLLLEEVTTARGINAAEGVNAASEEVSTAELVRIRYIEVGSTTKLLEPIPEPHQVQQNDSNVTFAVSSMEQGEGIVEQHPANVEETRVLYDSLYNNLAIEVEKVNSVNCKLRETNANLTTEFARYKNQEKCFEISQEKYDKLERCYQKSVYQEQCLTKKINALHLSLEADESLSKHKALELEIERLLRAVVSQDIMSIVQNNYVVDTSNLQTELELTSNSVPTTKESKVVENEKVIAPGMFRINPFKNSREVKFMSNKPVNASVRRNPITDPQPHVITKKVNDRVPSASKSSRIKNKEVKVEDRPMNLLLSKNKKHMSSECNNIKLAIPNDKSKIVCVMCKQCLITENHDVCVLNYVNGMNSHSKKQKANVSNIANQTKHKAHIWKPKNVGSKERLASPKASKPRMHLRWSPTRKMFDIKGKLIPYSESNGDNAFTPNPQEHIIKQFLNSTFSLDRGKENGLQILQLIDQGPFELGTTRDSLGTTPKGGVLLGPERPHTYEDLSDTEKKQYDADVRATNIVLQGLPKDIYKLINHNIEAKAIWDNVKMLLAGSELTKEDRESQLYDDFERFKMLPGENINEYYVRFHKLVNDMRNIRMTMPNIQLNSKFVNNMPPEWDRFVTAVKLNKGLKETNHEQLYAYLKQHEKHAAQDRLIIKRITPATNDQLAFVSTVQPHAQSSHNQNQRYLAQGNGTTGNGGAQNRVGNANAGQGKPIKCYNYNGIGHIARNCTQPKHPQNSDYFKDRMLLMQAQENGAVLDEEELLFLADECDAFDSDVDDEPTAQSIFMANFVLSRDEHEVHNKVQPSDVIDPTSVHMGNNNVTPYEQYLSDNDISGVPNCASSALNSVCVSPVNDAFVLHDPIATELKIYKEHVAIYEQRAKFELTEREQ